MSCLFCLSVPAAGPCDEQTVANASRANDVRKSGLQVGDQVPTFYVRAITGPLANKSVCYVCRNGDRPVVMVLVRQVVPELTGLLKRIDAAVDERRAQGLRSFGVFITSDSKPLAPQLQTLAFDAGISMPLTIAAAPTDGPFGAGAAPEPAVTVLLYREQRVVAHLDCRPGELDAPRIDTIMESVKKLGSP